MNFSIRLFVLSILFVVAQTSHALDLPPEAQRDVLTIQLADHLKHEQWNKAYPLFKRIEALNLRHNLAPDSTVTYFKGEAAFNLKKHKEAGNALARYINLAGSQGKYYIKALQLLAKLDAEINAKAEDYYSKAETYFIGHKNAEGKWIRSYIDALPWLEKAAKLGHPSAMEQLGYLYRKGTSDGIKRDRKKSLYWYQLGAEKDHIPAINGLAEMHMKGLGTKKDSQKALTLFQSIAELGQFSDFTGESRQGYVKAHRSIAKIYLDANGVERNIEEGIAWLEKIADEDYPTATELGDVYANTPPRPGIKQDYSKAAFWYRKAARETCLKNKILKKTKPGCGFGQEAKIKLADLYQNGLGVEKDQKWAFQLYQSGKANGMAKLEIARSYKFGMGVKPDAAKAREWFLKAIEDSDSEKETVTRAEYELAQLYEEGKGGEQDYKKAFELYKSMRTSRTVANPILKSTALYRTAMFYLNGQGVDKDPARARNRMFEPAEDSYHPAMLELAAMFENGIGGKENRQFAANWYGKVAKLKPHRVEGPSQKMVDTANEGLARLAGYSPETDDSPETFLSNNRQKPGVMVTSSGLQYKFLTKGLDNKKPTANDKVLIHYRGMLTSSMEFSSSIKRGKPVILSLFESDLSKGLSEGLMLMAPGDKIELVIPSKLGYGQRSMINVPAGSVLIYEVELLEINPQ